MIMKMISILRENLIILDALVRVARQDIKNDPHILLQ